MELKRKPQNLQQKCHPPFDHTVQAFWRSLTIVILQVIRRKNMDPNAVKKEVETMCLLCYPSILSV